MVLINSNSDVKVLLREVQDVFCSTEEFLETTNDDKEIKRYFESLDEHFYPVAIESLSYFLTQKELPEGNELPLWNKWFDYFSPDLHLFLFVGFGMAAAKLERYDIDIQSIRKHPMSDMIYDGMGYYDALFNARKVIIGQLTNDRIPKYKINLYDQGIGRRLWYYVNGNTVSALEHIRTFSENRQKSLLRGFGIAYAFVESWQEIDWKDWKPEIQQSFVTGILMTMEVRTNKFDFIDIIHKKIYYISEVNKKELNNFIKTEISGREVFEQIDKIEVYLKNNYKTS